MGEKSIIIIGAGLAGLSTGCYAQMNGYKTHIFEQHTIPGGVCTAWQRKGYTIDGCIHWLMYSKPGSTYYDMYKELGALEGNRVLAVNEYVKYIDEKTGQSLAFTSDLDLLAADMKNIAPEDEKFIDEFLGCCRALQGLDLGIPKPKEIRSIIDSIKMTWDILPLLKYVLLYNVTVESFTNRIHNKFLRESIYNLFLPQMPAYFLFVLIAQLASGELGVIQGGSQKFSDAIARRYESLGGRVTYQADVTKIIVENERAVGIQLADGSEHRADIIVSACDGYSTIFQMLEGKYIDQEIRDRFDNWGLYPPIMLVSFGVSREFPDEASTKFLFLENSFACGSKEVNELFLRIFNYDPTLSLPGKTVLQVMLETDFDFWNELHKDKTLYQAKKSEIAAEILSRLEAHYPGITRLVEMTDVATPYTFFRYSRNHRGSYEGWLMTKEVVNKQVPKTLPGLGDFYMAGQWVEPGGGIPPALYSGRNLVEILCNKDGKEFKILQ